MVLKTIENCPVNKIDLYIHIKCIIIHTFTDNVLFEFHEGTRLKKELSTMLLKEDLDKAMFFLKSNCSKLKFDEKKNNKPNQLSLF